MYHNNQSNRLYILEKTSLVDRHRFDADPDPNFHFDPNPGPDLDRHQNDADLLADPSTRNFTHVGK
jgi:hypothetical protein